MSHKKSKIQQQKYRKSIEKLCYPLCLPVHPFQNTGGGYPEPVGGQTDKQGTDQNSGAYQNIAMPIIVHMPHW